MNTRHTYYTYLRAPYERWQQISFLNMFYTKCTNIMALNECVVFYKGSNFTSHKLCCLAVEEMWWHKVQQSVLCARSRFLSNSLQHVVLSTQSKSFTIGFSHSHDFLHRKVSSYFSIAVGSCITPTVMLIKNEIFHCLTLGEENRLMVFESRMQRKIFRLKRGEVTGK